MRTDVYVGQDRPTEATVYIDKRKRPNQPSSRVTIVSGPDHVMLHLSDAAFDVLIKAVLRHVARE